VSTFRAVDFPAPFGPMMPSLHLERDILERPELLLFERINRLAACEHRHGRGD
jgi:hypothetical protein